MSKQERITREDILEGAARIVRERGAGALNARAVARELGCSTQPVYSRFASMDALREALLEEGKERYRRFIEHCFSGAKSRYEAYGLGFVKFAREERGFYRMLFLENTSGDPFLADILSEMEVCYRMTEAEARAFHTDMTAFSYGLASLVYAGAELHDEEISAAFCREFYALYSYYFPQRPRFWEAP